MGEECEQAYLAFGEQNHSNQMRGKIMSFICVFYTYKLHRPTLTGLDVIIHIQNILTGYIRKILIC